MRRLLFHSCIGPGNVYSKGGGLDWASSANPKELVKSSVVLITGELFNCFCTLEYLNIHGVGLCVVCPDETVA